MDKRLELVGEASTKNLATDHKFVLQGAERQSLAVFSTTNAKGMLYPLCVPVVFQAYILLVFLSISYRIGYACNKLWHLAGEKRSMEGRVVQKVDCRPVVSHNYMKLKRTQMIEACKPKRITKQLESAVTTVYKPVNVVKEEVRIVWFLFTNIFNF